MTSPGNLNKIQNQFFSNDWCEYGTISCKTKQLIFNLTWPVPVSPFIDFETSCAFGLCYLIAGRPGLQPHVHSSLRFSHHEIILKLYTFIF
jgi:hypothetical protein